MMRVRFFFLFLFIATTLCGQKREVHILSVNDMHAAMNYMPQLAAIADSLRELYPSLMVLSAGDNRTGNPLSDLYNPSGYPMVALMNQIGFNASAVGNHEFDRNSLPRLIGKSNFRYLCANVGKVCQETDTVSPGRGAAVRDTIPFPNVSPYQVFDVEGLRVGIISVVQVNSDKGTPDTHPDNIEGLCFSDPLETVKRFEWLSRECDVTILLSHGGYRNDTLTAHACPWLDLIIGGHSHKQLKADERRNGILITQNVNRLRRATHITVTVDSGRVTDTKAEYINVRDFSHENALVAEMVSYFNNNPEFRRVLAQAKTPFENIYEIGCMVCDAVQFFTDADVSLHNYRGIRVESMPAGEITVMDVLEMDPFGNVAYMLMLNGEELYQMVKRYCRMEVGHFPHLGGLRAEITLDKNDPEKITDIDLRTADGKRLDKKRIYRVATNSYVAAAFNHYKVTTMERINRETSDMIMRYLEMKGTVDYHGVKRIVFH